MFECDELIYIQMPKTGCTHIALLLSKLFDGKQIGKHNAATAKQIAAKRYCLSSIRNPWDWYLSLWTFGVQGNGGLMHRLTTQSLRRALKLTLEHPQINYSSLFYELSKPTEVFSAVYRDSQNIEAFRHWLKLIHAPDNSPYIGEGYGGAGLNKFCGFMTYRYLYLCCQNSRELYKKGLISNYADLVRFENQNCYIDFFIRQEKLEDDLCRAVAHIRPLTVAEKDLIYNAQKTNASQRSRSISDYYDAESIELIQNRDRLLIEKFAYLPAQPGEIQVARENMQI